MFAIKHIEIRKVNTEQYSTRTAEWRSRVIPLKLPPSVSKLRSSKKATQSRRRNEGTKVRPETTETTETTEPRLWCRRTARLFQRRFRCLLKFFEHRERFRSFFMSQVSSPSSLHSELIPPLVHIFETWQSRQTGRKEVDANMWQRGTHRRPRKTPLWRRASSEIENSRIQTVLHRLFHTKRASHFERILSQFHYRYRPGNLCEIRGVALRPNERITSLTRVN